MAMVVFDTENFTASIAITNRSEAISGVNSMVGNQVIQASLIYLY